MPGSAGAGRRRRHPRHPARLSAGAGRAVARGGPRDGGPDRVRRLRLGEPPGAGHRHHPGRHVHADPGVRAGGEPGFPAALPPGGRQRQLGRGPARSPDVQLFEPSAPPGRMWRSGQAERLASYPIQYAYAVVIDFNRPAPATVVWAPRPGEYVTSRPSVVGRGSAIFLHVDGAGSTAGCVSVTRPYDRHPALAEPGRPAPHGAGAAGRHRTGLKYGRPLRRWWLP
jgi:hypothetical protein